MLTSCPSAGTAGGMVRASIHSTGLQKTLFAPPLGRPRRWRGFLFPVTLQGQMPNTNGGAGGKRPPRTAVTRGDARRTAPSREAEVTAGRTETRLRDETTPVQGDGARAAELER